MSVKTRVRSSAQQIKMLTDYMATHPSLAHGQFTGPQAKLREQRLWEDLQTTLNEYGPDKTVDQWKVTWRDLRRKARNEGSIANRADSPTDNASVMPVLSDIKIEISGVMGTGTDESGDAPSMESKVTGRNKVSIEYAPRSSVQPAPSVSTSRPHKIKQQQQEPRARVNQFLQTEPETNNNSVLRNVARQLEIANKISAARVRLTYKEKLWRLRKETFK